MERTRPRPREAHTKPPRFAPVAAPPVEPGRCRGCHGEVPAGRRTWCSARCVDEYAATRSSAGLRRLLFRRDVGVCAVCRLDCTFLENRIRSWRKSSINRPMAMALRKLLCVTHRKTLWDADHIRPVSEGGGSCGLENIQTLCLWCHKNKSAYQRQTGSAVGWTLPSGAELLEKAISELSKSITGSSLGSLLSIQTKTLRP